MSHEPGPQKVELIGADGKAIGVPGNPLETTGGGGGGGTVDQGAAGSAAEAWWVQPTVDGVTVSLPLPVGAATETTLADIKTQQTDGSQKTEVTNFPASQVVTGPLTDTQLRAAPVPVSGIVTATPSGTQDVNLLQVGGAAVTLGQAANAASIPVALSSTQTGTAGTPAAQVLSIQGVASGTAVPTSNATTSQADGHSVNIGALADAASANTLTGLFKAVKAAVQGTLATDVTDRAARLLGVVYGSLGQQLKQTATNFNLATETFVGGSAVDPRSIRALVSGTDSVTVTGTVTTTPSGTQNTNITQVGGNTVTTSLPADIIDRAARLLGVVFGSQGQQLQQSATNFNLLSELRTGATAYDARQIRSLSSGSDSVAVTSVDGALASVGTTTDAEAAGNGTLIAIAKRLRTLLGGGLPAALVGGRLDVNAGSVSLMSGRQQFGTITANGQTVVIDCTGASAILVQVTGTYNAALQFEGLVNVAGATPQNTTYVTQNATVANVNPGASNVPFQSLSGGLTGLYQVQNAAGLSSFQIRCSAFTSGQANVYISCVQPASNVVQAEIARWFGAATPTIGQKAGVNSIPAVLANDVALQLHVDRTNSGLLLSALNQTTPISCAGLHIVRITATITGTITLVFESSQDGTTFPNALLMTPAAGGAAVSTTTATGEWFALVAGYNSIRVRVSAVAGGSATIAYVGSHATRATQLTDIAGNVAQISSSSLAGTETGLIVRSIPSGSQTVTQATASNLNGQVQGSVAAGGSVTDRPVIVGGADSGGLVQRPRVESTGLQWHALSSQNLIGNAVGAPINAFVHANGQLRVATPPTSLFFDRFDGASLDTIRWATAVTGGGATASVSSGNLTLATGTTASAFVALTSNPSFTPLSEASLNFALTMRADTGTFGNNTHRFWGFGTAGANTTVNPLTDAVGFEVDTSGNLNAVVYAGGTKVLSQSLSPPTNLQRFHRWLFLYTSSTLVWYLDTEEVPVAYVIARNQTTPPLPNVQTLPVRLHVINGATPPAVAPVFVAASAAVGDSNGNNCTLSDSTYPFRKLTINADGSVAIAQSAAATPTVTKLTLAQNVSQTALAASATRKGAVFWSDSQFVQIKIGAIAGNSTDDYTVALPPLTDWALPDWARGLQVDVITTAAAGAVLRVTSGN